MNLYEWEGKQLFEKHGIQIPRGVVVRRDEVVPDVFAMFGISDVVVKAQVLSGKRGKNNAIRFCASQDEVALAVADLFAMDVRGQYVASVRIEEKLDIVEEHYLSITYDTNAKQPILIYSEEGGVDIEDVENEKIVRIPLDIRQTVLPLVGGVRGGYSEAKTVVDRNPTQPPLLGEGLSEIEQKLWNVFLSEDCRLVEINPLVKTRSGEWIAADAKVALDDDAFFRHSAEAKQRARSASSGQAQEKGNNPDDITDWEQFESRTMLGRPATAREISVAEIDKGEKYYQGTAGKYIEMDGDIAVLFSGGGASIANMDALKENGLEPANYTEYSGNPPREKVSALAKIVLSKPGLRGLWICGGVANFTNVEATFQGIVDALDEVKPTYPIVVRRAGPFETEGMELMQACAERNNLNMRLFGKETSMSETAEVLATLISKR